MNVKFQKGAGEIPLQKEKIMIYGYARCSTSESKQDINRQVKELKAAGAEEIYLEYEHGDKKIKPQATDVRPGTSGRYHHYFGGFPISQKHTTAL